MHKVLLELGSPVRYETIKALSQEGEMSVGDLISALNKQPLNLGVTQSSMSQHLKRLREREMVVTRRDQQRIFYSVSPEAAETIAEAGEELTDLGVN